MTVLNPLPDWVPPLHPSHKHFLSLYLSPYDKKCNYLKEGIVSSFHLLTHKVHTLGFLSPFLTYVQTFLSKLRLLPFILKWDSHEGLRQSPDLLRSDHRFMSLQHYLVTYSLSLIWEELSSGWVAKSGFCSTHRSRSLILVMEPTGRSEENGYIYALVTHSCGRSKSPERGEDSLVVCGYGTLPPSTFSSPLKDVGTKHLLIRIIIVDLTSVFLISDDNVCL